MFAAEFGYSEEHVDWSLDMDRVFAHMEYLKKNPPAGTVIKSLAEAYFGGKKGNKRNKNSQQNSNSDYDDGGQSRPKAFKNDEERLKWEESQLSALIQIFGGSGGIVRKGKKGGK